MQINKKLLTGLLLLGAISLGMSFPFTGSVFPLAFVALVPLFIFNFQLDSEEFEINGTKRFFIRFLGNYGYFLIFNVITTWWIYHASPSGAYMAFFANALLMTIPFALNAFVTRQLGESKGIIGFVVLWLSFEHFHYFWELSWPWLNFGHILGNQPWLIQWYAYSGTLGGTLWILLINILVYILIRNIYLRKEERIIQFPILLLLPITLFVPVIISSVSWFSYEELNDPVDVVVVQPNLDANTEKFTLPWKTQIDRIFEEARPLLDENVDLIVAPETAITEPMNEGNLSIQSPLVYIKSFLEKYHNIPMLIGADTHVFYDEPNSPASLKYKDKWYENYNTALLIDPNNTEQVYHKSKLVMGGERIPFIEYFDFLRDYSVTLGGSAGMLGAGNEIKNFTASGISLAPLICYESVYADNTTYFTRKGAEIICVITNDGWWKDTPGYKQHRSFSQIRAIENRRPVVRSANTGISCLIDQRGKILDELRWEKQGAIRGKVNKNASFTFFVKYGDVIGRISAFVSIAMFLYAITIFLKTATGYERR